MNNQPNPLRRLSGAWIIVLCFLAATLDASALPSPGWRDYRPDNIFSLSPVLPVRLVRVAVLPLTSASDRFELVDGCEILNQVLFEELVKTKRFEVVSVRGEALRFRTGRAGWTGVETLPAGYFEALQRDHGCDAVIFPELTVYRAYAPISVGWRLKLVDIRTRKIIWAADEVFDASRPAVASGSKHFQPGASILGPDAGEVWMGANSPRRFGSYSLSALLKTLPER